MVERCVRARLAFVFALAGADAIFDRSLAGLSRRSDRGSLGSAPLFSNNRDHHGICRDDVRLPKLGFSLRRFSQVESAPISRDLEPIKPTARQVLSKVV